MDVDARIQLFDLKNTYVFQTTPGIDSYNMPLYTVQVEPGAQNIGPFPVYQGFEDPIFVNGIQVPFYTERNGFWNLWPNYVQALNPATVGDGTAGPYTFTLPYFPAVPGHVDMNGIIAYFNDTGGTLQDPPIVTTLNTAIPNSSVYPGVTITSVDATGASVVITDSGQFLSGNLNYGLLMKPGPNPSGNTALNGGNYGTSVTPLNCVNYATGVVASLTFPVAIPTGQNINAQVFYYQQGIPRAVLFYNNTITIRPPPNIQYRIEMTGYLSPAAFLNTSYALPFAYMAEYIARGAARKILSDTGDWEQFNLYEPLFIEQERLVWKRSQRQFTSTRTGTIFSQTQNQGNYNTLGAGSA